MAGIADLVNEVVTASGVEISKKDADTIVKTVFETISQFANGGESVTIRGFGTFKNKTRAARTCRNPQKPGETINVPEKTVLTFKAAK